MDWRWLIAIKISRLFSFSIKRREVKSESEERGGREGARTQNGRTYSKARAGNGQGALLTDFNKQTLTNLALLF
jgi:hypothetical protein